MISTTHTHHVHVWTTATTAAINLLLLFCCFENGFINLLHTANATATTTTKSAEFFNIHQIEAGTDPRLSTMWREEDSEEDCEEDSEEGTRYDFHHDNGSYTLGHFLVSVIDERTTEKVTYRLHRDSRGRSFPLRELMYTFVEQIGVRMEQLEFRYHGDLVPINATPDSIGMDAFRPEGNVIAVSTMTSPYDRRVEMFTRLNRMAKVLVGAGSYQGGTDVFSTELLPHLLDFVDLETLVHISQVCRHWFHVAQRYSVLLQLQDGDSHTWDEDQKYPLLLHDGCRHSFNLALCDAKARKAWNTSAMRKESTDNLAYGFCKASGCTVGKTISMESIPRDLDSKWEALNSAKTEFMKQIVQENEEHPHGRLPGVCGAVKDGLEQVIPPVGEERDGFITEARDWRYKNCAVELYRRYFSPDMHFIFPLIVNQQAALGLEFQSTHTDLIFGAPPVYDPVDFGRQREFPIRPIREAKECYYFPSPGELPSPLGSVSWRIHDADEVAAKGIGGSQRDTMARGWNSQIILEVLFIAVWEADRGGEYGSALVTALQSKAIGHAKSQGHKFALMYVEIGFEQPKAKQFWKNNGFTPIRRNKNVDKTLATGSFHGGEGETLELKDWQLGFIDRRCLRFKDTEQYAKRVLV